MRKILYGLPMGNSSLILVTKVGSTPCTSTTKASKMSRVNLNLDGTGFYAHPRWSPDSKKISFVDNGRNLYVLNTDSGRVTKIAEDERYMPGVFRDLFGSWSHDSNWVSYTVVTGTSFEQAYVYSLSENRSYPNI
jgi:tricorn protease-like protein